MKVIRMVQFEDDDESIIRRVQEWCNEAQAFFVDRTPKEPVKVPEGTRIVVETRLRITGDEMRSINRLSAGHPLSLDHLSEALRDLVAATRRVRETAPHKCFPAELKARYEDNLSQAQSIVQGWIDEAHED